jgi:hypothetical protein
MATIFSFNQKDSFDYESAIDEVELLVPKYLEMLKYLEESQTFEEIPSRLKNVTVYWSRLSILLKDIQNLEQDDSIANAIKNSLQSELNVLEKIYLKAHERMNFSEKHWTESMWKSAELTLLRMDEVLCELGFDYQHKDRVLIRELMQTNLSKKKKVTTA